MVTQSTSPMFSHKAFWCIEKSISNVSLHTIPYHAYIPSFGEWGFVLATHMNMQIKPIDKNLDLKYLNSKILEKMQLFPKDIAKIDVKSNRISTHKLIYYYDQGWRKWYEN